MFVQNMEKLASSRSMSLSAVANALGMSRNAATKWRNGAIPNAQNLQKIADYFNVSVEYLLSDNPQPVNNMGTATSSTILQGVHSRDISVGAPASSGLSEYEEQLLGIVRQLDLKSKTSLLMQAIELQEAMQTK